jgi:pectate lyase
MMMKYWTSVFLFWISIAGYGQEQKLAFPGAEGFGKYTTGGRAGKVYIVTNLNDNGPGSLREAINRKEARIIVFAISGTIALESPLVINNGDVTIAGQSAPGEGICLKNYTVTIQADNVIVRYLRFRLGDEKGQEADAAGGTKGKSNIIIDHCSMSWATDECASFYRNKNFTMQWCIVSESLNHSIHQKGDHGYGGIWGGEKATFHHNLIANHTSRMPRFSGSSTTPNSPEELVDFRNNVIYNWRTNNTYGGEKGRYNVVNNYYKPGPATSPKKLWIVDPTSPYGKFYIDGNCLEGNAQVSKDNWNGGMRYKQADSARVQEPFDVEPINVESAEDAWKQVLKNAGASYKRDAVDSRIIAEAQSGKSRSGKEQNGIIDSQRDVGGWPVLKSEPALADKDADGIPDGWETKHKLDPASGADGASYTLSKQYTNLEVYLNELVKQ